MNARALRSVLIAALLVASLTSVAGTAQPPAKPAVDPVVKKIIDLGTTDNRVMTWNDYASNRFGGRETGTNAYTDTVEWAAWQFRQFGLQVELDEAGEVPVGFNRGPWFGKMIKPAERSLYFGTPTFTAGTKGRQRGPVVILKSDPFSIPGRNAKPEDIEKKKAAVEAAIAEVKANKAAFKGAWVLIPGENTGFARDGRKGTPEYADSQLIPKLTAVLVEAGALGTIQSSKTDPFRMLDGYVESWDKLPELPDIKLAEGQWKEIKGLAEKGQPVELEFDIRNWFKMGPVKYHSVVATLRGTEFPDEYVVLGGHLDCFSSATGAIDDGSGFAPMAEAIRLIQAAGRQAQAVDRGHPFRRRRAGPRRLAGLAEEPPRHRRQDRDDDQPRRQPERHHRGQRARDLVRRLQGAHRPARLARPEVALQARTRRAPGPRHKPRTARTRRRSRCRACRRCAS